MLETKACVKYTKITDCAYHGGKSTAVKCYGCTPATMVPSADYLKCATHTTKITEC